MVRKRNYRFVTCVHIGYDIRRTKSKKIWWRVKANEKPINSNGRRGVHGKSIVFPCVRLHSVKIKRNCSRSIDTNISSRSDYCTSVIDWLYTIVNCGRGCTTWWLTSEHVFMVFARSSLSFLPLFVSTQTLFKLFALRLRAWPQA